MKRSVGVLLAVAVAILIMPRSARADGPDGAAIYKSKCAMCHGPDGKGLTTMGKSLHLKDLGSDDVQKVSDADLTKLIHDGKGKMPAYKGKLDDASIAALVAQIRTFKPHEH
jgi:cytochrome c6